MFFASLVNRMHIQQSGSEGVPSDLYAGGGC
jgi:hypothetical protein